jgi:hypothetical protein
MSRAERLHSGLFRGEPAGKMNCRHAASRAVRDLAVSEDAAQESVAISFDRGGDAVNFGGVEAKTDDG